MLFHFTSDLSQRKTIYCFGCGRPIWFLSMRKPQILFATYWRNVFLYIDLCLKSSRTWRFIEILDATINQLLRKFIGGFAWWSTSKWFRWFGSKIWVLLSKYWIAAPQGWILKSFWRGHIDSVCLIFPILTFRWSLTAISSLYVLWWYRFNPLYFL
jgi:hypothetical protein